MIKQIEFLQLTCKKKKNEMEFFETSEKVVVYMNKKRLELLITHLGSTLSLTNSSGSQVSYYAFISKKKQILTRLLQR